MSQVLGILHPTILQHMVRILSIQRMTKTYMKTLLVRKVGRKEDNLKKRIRRITLFKLKYIFNNYMELIFVTVQSHKQRLEAFFVVQLGTCAEH